MAVLEKLDGRVMNQVGGFQPFPELEPQAITNILENPGDMPVQQLLHRPGFPLMLSFQQLDGVRVFLVHEGVVY